jgi:hypothetical protein
MSKDILKFIFFGAIVAVISVSGTFFYLKEKTSQNLNLKLTPEEAGKKAIEFINKNILVGEKKASLVKVSEVSGLYEIVIKIEDREYPSFVTKDGKILFPEAGIDMEKFVAQRPTPQPKKACEELKKNEKPFLEAFVVSKCPFGLQMQRILNEIIKEIPSLAENIKVKYIGSISNGKIISMHGDEEANENLRQICIREEQGEKFWSYIDCHIKEGKVNECLKSAGIDEVKLNECQKDSNRGLKYAQKDFESQQKYNVQGSPTLILNGEEVSEYDFGGRTAEAIKTLLCCGFAKRSEFCNKKLVDSQAAIGFSLTYIGQSSQVGGSCQ